MIPLAVAQGCGRDAADVDPSTRAGVARTRSGGERAGSTAAGLTEARHPIDRAETYRKLNPDYETDLSRLVEGLDDPEPLVRGVAVATLMKADPTRLLGQLAASAEEQASDERTLLEIELLRRVGSERPDRYRGALCHWALELESAELRSRAAAGCIERESPGSDLVDRLAEDEQWIVRTRVALAAQQSPGSEWEQVIHKLADDVHPTVRQAARSGTPDRVRSTGSAGAPGIE
jgi:hypothetical protein